jgi:hypothetical protein
MIAMPVKPDSRFANLPVLQVVAPDGSVRQAISLRLARLQRSDRVIRQHRVTQGEQVDLIAQKVLRAEHLWWRILDVNPLIYPLDVQPGDLLDLPDPGPATRTTRARRF